MKKETSTSTGNQAQTAPTSFPDPVTILRTCDKDLRSYNGFQWPESGYVEAPDFKPTAECGHGLHGLLDGRGDWDLMDWSLEAKALIVETDRSQLIELSGKVKFKSAIVKKITSLGIALCEVFCNALSIRREVDEIMKSAQPTQNSKTNTLSYAQVANSGDSARVANSGTSAQVANSGTYAQVANSGTSARLESTGKNSVIVSAGKDAVVSGVEGCAFALTWWTPAGSPRVAVAYVGKDGIKPDTFYKLNAKGKFVEVKS